jgi:hypothetical protein
LTAARRGGTYRRRCLFAFSLLAVLLLPFGAARLLNIRGELSIRQMAVLASSVVSLVAFCQVSLTVLLVPAAVAGSIVEEKERRTLTALLTTRLGSAEIVLGKLGAGLVQYGTWLATGLPIVILLPLLGGIDPRLVVLLYAATGSTAFFMGGLSILVATAARRRSRAVAAAFGLGAFWMTLPILVQLVTPRAYPRLSPWVLPINQWLLASSPSGVLVTVLGVGPGWRFFDSVYWMIGLQLGAGSLLMAWAVARFRSACRNQAGQGGDDPRSPGWLLGRFRPRLWRRPSCGANPVLWKELHTARPRGLAHVLGAVIALGLFALIGYGTYRFARPAFREWFEHGLGPATSDIQRTAFNQFLRHITSWVEFFTLLIAAGVASEGVTAERARETWDGLVATSLEARAILGAKMIGALWKVRWGLVLLGFLWLVGLLAGAVHPLGFAAALVLLGVATWFVVALGTFMSLVSRDSAQASNRTLIPVLLLSGSFLIGYLPALNATILMGVASVPLVNWLSLLSYRDVSAIVSGQRTLSVLAEVGVSKSEGPLQLLATCTLEITGTAAAAVALTRAALSRFDRTVGRPERAPDERRSAVLPVDVALRVRL